MRASVTVASPAKINLQLAVGPARPDGFHTLATVYQAIGLYDEVAVTPAATTTLTVTGEGVDASDVPTDSTNLAVRAARLLASRAGVDGGVAISIRKRIPVMGGMAGGSTDGAAALLACDTLWELDTPREELLALAAELGSDVPFCLVGHTAGGSGRGELVHSVDDAGSYWWVVALSAEGLSTPAVFAEFDRRHAGTVVPEPEVSASLLAALAAGDATRLGASLANDLEAPALTLRPDLAAVLDLGGRPPALGALLSGSGPTCLFLAADEVDALKIRDVLRDAGTTALVARGPVPGAHVVSSL
ncbi:MAG TPA: 4-(cytidine 5'-diphospho)-2-C-methyl-D-erythritol kinase [Nocardioidaceae bacterium]|nr:4-(cytidine 5'-diphospho)-2-C-methyl-D-erythritol kinase [Nocardioidaceae bacterium]